jgi:hypothetical protein
LACRRALALASETSSPGAQWPPSGIHVCLHSPLQSTSQSLLKEPPKGPSPVSSVFPFGVSCQCLPTPPPLPTSCSGQPLLQWAFLEGVVQGSGANICESDCISLHS